MSWFEGTDFWTTFGPILFNTKRREAAADEVTAFLTLAGSPPAGSKILDLCCGIGRHSVELAKRGFAPVGVDNVPHYLDKASLAAREAGVAVELVRADSRDFVRPATFAAALNLFTSFGYHEDPRDDVRVLSNVHASLVPGGRLVMDMLSKEVVARGFNERTWTRLEPGVILLEELIVSRDWTWATNRWTLVRQGEERSFTLEHRLYSGSELRTALLEAGFAKVELNGSLAGTPYDTQALRLVAVAERAP